MCNGISIHKARIRQELFELYELEKRISARLDQQELHFMYGDRTAQLPVLRDGQLEILEWGNRDNKESRLPRTGWCRMESVEAGKWRWLKPEIVVIPADAGLEKGVWFQIVEGMKGMLVEDEQRRPHVYMLTQPASHYYQTMTKHARMPILIEQVI